MIAALKFAKFKSERLLYMYDTFDGMTTPEKDIDVNHDNIQASEIMDKEAVDKRNSHTWAVASLEEVKRNLASTQYKLDCMNFIKGPVEETIPSVLPDKICVLRLDTDWYSSTYHELVHLYPLVSIGGFIIIDDYGHWKGARKAVDDYFLENATRKPFLHRVDYSCRLIQKL